MLPEVLTRVSNMPGFLPTQLCKPGSQPGSSGGNAWEARASAMGPPCSFPETATAEHVTGACHCSN